MKTYLFFIQCILALQLKNRLKIDWFLFINFKLASSILYFYQISQKLIKKTYCILKFLPHKRAEKKDPGIDA